MPSLLMQLRLARRDFFKLRRHREAPAWAMWLMTLLVSLAWGLGLLLLTLMPGRNTISVEWWQRLALPFLATSLLIGICFHSVYTLIERRASDRFLQWANGKPGVGVTLFFVFISMGCVALGLSLAYLLLGSLPGVNSVSVMPSRSWIGIAVTCVVVSVIWGFVSWQQWQEEQFKRQAQEAQLQLLQAQIEPHFLFNTLANVQSLMDHDLPKARRMLSDFTDYLRASLGNLRAQNSNVGQELELARSYLSLLQQRMEGRLHFDIDTRDAAACAQPLPPLLLQPLVENAVVHGLEPSIDGGTVRVSARLEGAQLMLEVHDDGRGFDAPPRLGARRGSGLALNNIRQRLLTRYGPEARLEVQAAHPGTRARITLPLQTAL